MGMIINIDEALKLRSDYNVLKEPLHAMMRGMQEGWEKKNPIDLIYNRGTISSFQETYTSSIGFDHAFTETSDYAIGPLFNQAEGFAATYRTRTFQGSFIISQQTLEDGNYGRVKDDAASFIKRWHGDQVEYAMKALEGGFGTTTWAGGDGKNSTIRLTSADTNNGLIDGTGTNNLLFSSAHTVIRREGMTDDQFNALKQSNVFAPNQTIDLTADDSSIVSRLADLINQVITIQENYKDDNGKIAGVDGRKMIVCANNPQLKNALKTAIATERFNRGESMDLNPIYDMVDVETTPYLNEIARVAGANDALVPGFFIVDKAYNAENHGLEITERIPFTLDVIEQKRPKGIIYDGRERFDVNVATWRGIAFVSLVAPTLGNITVAGNTVGATTLTLVSSIAKPVTVVNTVKTKEQS